MSNELENLLAEYWDAAYCEGLEGRTHDTEDGRAQCALSALREYYEKLESALQKIAAGRGMIKDKSTIYMNGKVPLVPKIFNMYDMREIAAEALKD